MSVVSVTRMPGASVRKSLTRPTMSSPSLPVKKFQYARSTAPPGPRAHEDRSAAPPAAAVARRKVRRDRRCEGVIDHPPLHRGKTLSGRRLPVKGGESRRGDAATTPTGATGDETRRRDPPGRAAADPFQRPQPTPPRSAR